MLLVRLIPLSRSRRRDPEERHPKIEAREDRGIADHLRNWLVQHRYLIHRVVRTERQLFGRWKCSANDLCRYLEHAAGPQR